MKYLVGETDNGTAVFAVKGNQAINLTVLDSAVGRDLMALISDPALAESVELRASLFHPLRQRFPSPIPERSFALA